MAPAGILSPPDGGLVVAVEPDDRGVVLRVSGEVDPATAPVLDGQVDRALVGGFPRIVLDLRQVEFMDSSGLRSLIRAREAVGRHHRALVVQSPSPPVRRVLDVTGLTDVLEIVE